MKQYERIEILGEELLLLPERAICLQGHKTVLISDLHLGKASHFQKKGINVPVDVMLDDIKRLEAICCLHDSEHVIVLGDLFHAEQNNEWDVFGEWLNRQSFRLTLVKGNHDVLPFTAYEQYNIEVKDLYMNLGNFILTHKPLEDSFADKYILSGHIHPAIVLKGKAYQQIRTACFFFGKHQGLLPSFGTFTGYETISPKKNDKVFAIAGEQVFAVPAL